jgi:para-nitrobenzyl esterase
VRRRDFLATSGWLAASSLLVGCGGSRPGPIIDTKSGPVQGQVIDGIHQYLGIPYAEPPFGLLRFMPPRPRSSWDDVLAAQQYGLACVSGSPLDSNSPPTGEDCLNLNIWTPEPAASNLPVMVWVHGGAGDSGSGSLPIYNGARFAAEGVVLVTCNRRLGAESGLYLERSEESAVGPGNLGVLDQIAVLHWVQEHIGAFGGDANNVTLFGHAEGAAVVQAVVATPASLGLLHRVIPQSGPYAAHRPSVAQQITEFALAQLGIKKDDLEALRSVSSKQLAALYPQVQSLGLGDPYPPVISDAMPVHPADAAHAGFGLDLDYLTGSEANLGARFIGSQQSHLAQQRVERVFAAGQVRRQALSAVYRQQHPELIEQQIEIAIAGDMSYRVPALRVAQGHALRGTGTTYCYRSMWPTKQQDFVFGGDLMVFGNGHPMTGAVEEETLRAAMSTGEFMRKAWCNFARIGDPSVESMSWPQYDSKQQLTLAIDAQPRVLPGPFMQQRQVLGRVMTDNWQAMGL